MTADRRTDPTTGDVSPPAAGSSMTTYADGLDFVATRVFAAPRTLVFGAFSECRNLARWWGPEDWTLPVCEMDFRTGGSWFYCMSGPDAQLSCGRSTYREIVSPERIVYVDVFVDRAGNLLPGMPEMQVVLTFDEQDGRTTLTSRATFASANDLETVVSMGMVDGLTETWDRLEAFLATA